MPKPVIVQGFPPERLRAACARTLARLPQTAIVHQVLRPRGSRNSQPQPSPGQALTWSRSGRPSRSATASAAACSGCSGSSAGGSRKVAEPVRCDQARELGPDREVCWRGEPLVAVLGWLAPAGERVAQLQRGMPGQWFGQEDATDPHRERRHLLANHS